MKKEQDASVLRFYLCKENFTDLRCKQVWVHWEVFRGFKLLLSVSLLACSHSAASFLPKPHVPGMGKQEGHRGPFVVCSKVHGCALNKGCVVPGMCITR